MIPLPKALKRFLNFFVFFEWTARCSGRGGEGKTTHTRGQFAATPNPSRRADTQRVIRHGWRANVFGGIALRSGLRGLHWRLGSLAFVMCVVAHARERGAARKMSSKCGMIYWNFPVSNISHANFLKLDVLRLDVLDSGALNPGV